MSSATLAYQFYYGIVKHTSMSSALNTRSAVGAMLALTIEGKKGDEKKEEYRESIQLVHNLAHQIRARTMSCVSIYCSRSNVFSSNV